MPKSSKKQLRALWLQVHKWIGLILAVLIVPISLTGSALVWHEAQSFPTGVLPWWHAWHCRAAALRSPCPSWLP